MQRHFAIFWPLTVCGSRPASCRPCSTSPAGGLIRLPRSPEWRRPRPRLARDAGGRVRHVQMKDVDAEVAERVRAGDLSYGAAVRAGLYRPLGQGDLDLRSVLDELDGAGYEGWYVLEQDTALDADPAPGEGPIISARQSLEFFRGLHGVERKQQEETA